MEKYYSRIEIFILANDYAEMTKGFLAQHGVSYFIRSSPTPRVSGSLSSTPTEDVLPRGHSKPALREHCHVPSDYYHVHGHEDDDRHNHIDIHGDVDPDADHHGQAQLNAHADDDGDPDKHR